MSIKTEARLLHACLGHQAPVYTIAPGTEDGTFFSGGSDRVVACWNVASGEQTGITIRTDAPVFSILAVAVTGHLWIGLSNGSVHVIDIDSRREVKHFRYHTSGVFDLKYDAVQKLVYSSDAEGNLMVWDAVELNHKATFPWGNFRIRNLFADPDAAKLYLSRGDGYVTVLETLNFNEAESFQAHENGCNVCIADHKGNIFTGGKDAWLKKWVGSVPEKGWPAHRSGIYDLVLSPDQRVLVSASRDKTIKCWDSHTLDPLLRIERKSHKGHFHSVNKLIWDKKSGYLVSAGDDRQILVWDITIS